MERVFVDTGGWYALLNQNESSHQEIKNFFRSNDLPLATSNFVVVELLNLLVARRQKKTAITFGKTLREKKDLSIFVVEPGDEDEAWKIFEKYGDQDFSFTDCTSFVLMRRLRIKKAVALDEDFSRMGFERIG